MVRKWISAKLANARMDECQGADKVEMWKHFLSQLISMVKAQARVNDEEDLLTITLL